MSSDQKKEMLELARGAGIDFARRLAEMKLTSALREILNEDFALRKMLRDELPDSREQSGEVDKILRILEANQLGILTYIDHWLPKFLAMSNNSETLKEVLCGFLCGLGIGITRSKCDPVLLIKQKDPNNREALMTRLPIGLAAAFRDVTRRSWTDQDYETKGLLISWISGEAVQALNPQAEQLVAAIIQERLIQKERREKR